MKVDSYAFSFTGTNDWWTSIRSVHLEVMFSDSVWQNLSHDFWIIFPSAVLYRLLLNELLLNCSYCNCGWNIQDQLHWFRCHICGKRTEESCWYGKQIARGKLMQEAKISNHFLCIYRVWLWTDFMTCEHTFSTDGGSNLWILVVVVAVLGTNIFYFW